MTRKDPKLKTDETAKAVVIKEDNTGIQHEGIVWLLTIAATLLSWVALVKVTMAVYHPDVEQLSRMGKSLLIDEGQVRPEPMEAMIFRLTVLLLVPAAVLFYKAFSGWGFVRRLAQKGIFNLLMWGGLVALCGLAWAGLVADNPYGANSGQSPQNVRDLVGTSNFDFYFKDVFTGKYLWLYLLGIVPATALLFLIGMKKWKLADSKYFSAIVNVAGYTMAAALILVIVAMNTVDYPYNDENKYDFSAVYYSMTQVFSGTPMLTDGFTNTYGLYPHFLLPLFRLTGLDVTRFSLVMSLLLGISLIMNLVVIRKLVRNPVLLFLGFFTVVYFPYINFKILTRFDCLFSIFPIRYLIPSLVSFLALSYFIRPAKWRYYITFITSALLVMWNPEIGIVCYLAWTATIIYRDFYDDSGKVNLKAIVRHALMGICLLPLAMLCYKGVIFAFYGKWPDMMLLFSAIAFFGKVGMGLLPMSLVHPWNLCALILLSGVIYAAAAWHRKKVTTRSAMVVFLTLAGVGYFAYFQGRSQNSNFSLSSGFSLILLTVLADELWQQLKTRNVPALNGIFVVLLVVLTFSVIELAYSSPAIMALTRQTEDKIKFAEMQKAGAANAAFIEKNTKEQERIIIIAPKKMQSLYLGGTKRLSAINPGYIDMFLKTDLVRLEETLIDSSFSVFITPSPNMYSYMIPPVSAMAATYDYAENTPFMTMLRKRTVKTPLQTYLADSNAIFHRKYNDTRESVKQRMADGNGTDTEIADSVLCVEAITYTSRQVFPFACIIGNSDSKTGFMMGCTNTVGKYLFGINGSGLTIVLPMKQWVYLTMNITPRNLELFVNGKRIIKKNLSEPMIASKNKICVGNIMKYHYYTGAIAEVSITNRLPDSTEVRNKWMTIEPGLK